MTGPMAAPRNPAPTGHGKQEDCRGHVGGEDVAGSEEVAS